MGAVDDLFDGFEHQGWNDDSKALLMARFIQQQKLGPAFDEFLRDVADEENADDDEDDEEEGESWS
jgi:hypothetical protein